MNMLMIATLIVGFGVKNMVPIEGGTFEMGDIFAEGAERSSPLHSVTVSSFYMAKYEVTVEEFSSFVEATDYKTSAEDPAKSRPPGSEGSEPREYEEYFSRLATRGCWALVTPSDGDWVGAANWRNPQYDQSNRDPVACVSWLDAVNYCNWLSKKEGLQAAYDGTSGALLDGQGRHTTDVTQVSGYRLPTEAEWEFAARERGKKVRFGNGRNIARAGQINFNANDGEFPFAEKGEYRKKTLPVGTFKPNSLGLHDMSGNVWEWCSDYFDRYTAEPKTNPYQTRGELHRRRAARGGPWVGNASLARVAVRFGWVADDRCNNIGFRVARSK